MNNRKVPGQTRARKFSLAAAGVVALASPVGDSRVIWAQTPVANSQEFDVASVKLR